MFSYLKNFYNYIYYNSKFLYLIYFICKYDISKLNENEISILKENIISGGPISIKFMQWYISNIFDSSNLKKNFSDIFDKCPVHSYKNTVNMFYNDFKIKLDDLIENNQNDYNNEIDKEVVGSGSIGQVYKMKLKNGKTVALKVKHPDANIILGNQELMIFFLLYLQKLKYLRSFLNLHFDIEGFINDLYLQINFKNEVFNCLRLRKNFYNNKTVIIPKIHFYSNNIIMYSYEEGIEINEISILKKQKVGVMFYCILAQMVMFDNFIHGDLHQKNWKVRLDHNKNLQIILYDFGLCYDLISKNINKNIWFSFEEQDVKLLINNIHMFFKQKDLQLISGEDIKNLEIDIEKTYTKKFSVESIFDIVIKFVKKKNIYINKKFFNVIITMFLLQEMFINTEFIKLQENNILEKKKLTLDRLSDLISYTKKYSFYKNQQNLYEERRVLAIKFIKDYKNKLCSY